MSRRAVIAGVFCVLLLVGVVLASGGQVQDSRPEAPVRSRPVPMVKYVIASPRACLIGPPVWSTNAYYLPSGAAENFPRQNGAIRVRVGTRVVFGLSRELEGVWYARSYGALGTSLELQWCRGCICKPDNWRQCVCAECACRTCKCLKCTCAQCACPEGNCADCNCKDCKCLEPAETDSVVCKWVTIGRDGAKDVRKGPSIGRAKVGVPVRFNRPGVYYLRGIVRTFARPYYPRPLEYWQELLIDPSSTDKTLPVIPAAADRDVVYVRVLAVDLATDSVEPEEGLVEDPDVENIKPMPKEVDSNDIEPLSGDLNGDETVNLADFAIMGQQWGREYEMPFADDE
jgi:hypothetical protein